MRSRRGDVGSSRQHRDADGESAESGDRHTESGRRGGRRATAGVVKRRRPKAECRRSGVGFRCRRLPNLTATTTPSLVKESNPYPAGASPWRGRMLVVTDRDTASAAESSAHLLKTCRGARTIGGPTAEMLCHGDAAPYLLWHSGMMFRPPAPRRRWRRSRWDSGRRRRRAGHPDETSGRRLRTPCGDGPAVGGGSDRTRLVNCCRVRGSGCSPPPRPLRVRGTGRRRHRVVRR